MSSLTPEQDETVRRVRLAMIANRSPAGRKPGSPSTCSACGDIGHNRTTCGRPALPPPVPRLPRPPAKPKLHRVDGHNHCGVCGELGHTAKRHDDSSPSARAALAVLSEGITMREAADRFGISRQAVQHTLRSRAPDMEPPSHTRRRARADRIAELAAAGLTAAEISEQVNCCRSVVNKTLRLRGLKARDPVRISDEEIATAVILVRNGASYAEAAAVLGRAAQRLADRLRALGIASSATGAGRIDGRSTRAIARVEAGESVPEACRAERCATVQVYKHFKNKQVAEQPSPERRAG